MATEKKKLVFNPTTGQLDVSLDVSAMAETADLAAYQLLSEKAVANGYASLDGGGKVPSAQLPNSVMQYQGQYDAATDLPVLSNGTGNAGDVYEVVVAGSSDFGAGAISFNVGDWVVYNGAIWQKSINSNEVVSVNGLTGAVNLSTLFIPESGNLYHTTARARAAAVVDSTAGSEVDQAPSVQSIKTYVTNSISTANTANKALSNLTATSINQTLLPSTNNLRSIGSAALKWATGFFNKLEIGSTLKIEDSVSLPYGHGSGTASSLFTRSDGANLGLFTQSTNDTVTSSADIFIETGRTNDPASTGNTGNVFISTGIPNGTGTKGEILLYANTYIDGYRLYGLPEPIDTYDAATKNYVDTSVAAVTGANTSLSNLGTTSISTDLLPDSDLARQLGSDALSWLRLCVGQIRSSTGEQINVPNRELKFDGSPVASWFNNGFQLAATKLLRFTDDANVETIGLKAPAAAAASIDYILPSAAPASNGSSLVSTTTGVMSWQSYTAPTIQSFTSGSGTYTTPANVKYIRVVAVGPGGGGGGGGTGATGGAGGTGSNTTFGTSLLVANAGAGGNPQGGALTSGGSASLGVGPLGKAIAGGQGSAGSSQNAGVLANSLAVIGGCGASSPLGGAGGGANFGAAGGSAIANTGSGGGGGSCNPTVSVLNQSGGGGAAGGYIDAIITAPSATYAYTVGTAGTAGTAGTNGFAGGSGGSGLIIVEEYYQ